MPLDSDVLIDITVNGQGRRTRAGQSLLGFLRELGIEPGRVAIELDRRIVKQSEWGSVTLEPGSRLEIVQFVGGG